MLIPSIIHQTWKDENIFNHSSIAILSQNSVKNIYPNYEYSFWTDKDIEFFLEGQVQIDLPHIYNIYRSLPIRMMQIDFVRYLWMYYFGGIYMDLDLICSRDITLEFSSGKDVFFIERGWKTDGYKGNISVHQAWLASTPRHPVWLDIMTFIGDNIKKYESDVLNLTGPNGISRAIDDRGLLLKYKNIGILSHLFWYQKGLNGVKIEQSYLQHEATCTWSKQQSFFIVSRNFLYRIYRLILKIF